MTATTNGDIWLLSTPNGQRGFFHEEFQSASDWTRFEVTALDCPRISPEFLEEEKRKLGPARFEQEYLCRFNSSAEDFFDLACFHNSRQPHPNEFDRADYPRFLIGFDLGQRDSHSAIAILELLTINTRDRDPVTYEFVLAHELRLTHIERIPLDRSYHGIAQHLRATIAKLPTPKRADLVLDATGSGAPFVDLLLSLGAVGADVTRVAFTSGTRQSYSSRVHLVPKKDLLHSLNLIINSPLFRIPPDLPNRHLLLTEMEGYRSAPTPAGNIRFLPGPTDDLIMALALAAWKAYKHIPAAAK
jgi:hypothetical protein